MKLFKKEKTIWNKKSTNKYTLAIVSSIIIGTACFFIGRQIGLNTDTSDTITTTTEETVSKHTITNTLSASGQIITALETNLSLNTNYYFKKIYVEEGDAVSKGDTLVEYKNGKKLKAPYDLVVNSINVPNTGKKITSSHKIGVSKTSELIVNISVNESEITNIHLGQEVEITLNADETKTYKGEITKINAIGSYSSSGSTFSVEVTLDNDGDIKLGMSVSCTIKIETLEDAIAVPVDAINIDGDRRYVIVVDGKDTSEVEVETGLSDGDYVEIKSGLSLGQTIQITTTTTQSTIRSTSESDSHGGMNGGDFGGGNVDFSNMPSMPSGGGFSGAGSGERPSKDK